MLTKVNFIASLLLLSMLSNLTLAQCVEGCSKCGLDALGAAECKICDLFSSFYKDAANKCVRRVIENCLIPSSDQNKYLCSQCKQGFMLDSTNLKCVEVPTTKQIANCRQYTLVGSCQACYQHYYLKNGLCSKANVVIDKCYSYFDDDLCKICEDGYYYDVKTTKCLKFEVIENCGSHTYGECLQCAPGTHKNANSSFFAEFNVESVQKITNNLWEGVNFNQYPNSVCLKNNDENCLEMSTTLGDNKAEYMCSKCKPDYYLDAVTVKCMPKPGWMIKDCSKYSSMSVCKECTAGNYLSCNHCYLRSTYENCAESNLYENKCFTCSASHFLLADGTCKKRENGSISKCTKFRKDEDLCEACESKFTLTEDQLACFAQIENCQTHTPFPYSKDLKLTCDDCSTNFYSNIEKTFCNEQSVQHCKKYDGENNICKECNVDYYISLGTNKCLEQSLDGCSTYQDNVNLCTNCKNLYSITAANTCTKLADVDCLTNNLNSVNCNNCQGNRLLKDESSHMICRSDSEYKDVDFCKSNTNSASDTKCTMCDDGNVLMTLSNTIKMKPTNCSDVNSSEICTSCVDNSDVSINSSTGNYTCVPATNQSSTCLSFESGYNSALGDNSGFCEKCRNTADYTLFKNTCYKRTAGLLLNCKTPGSKDECEVCKENFAGKSYANASGPFCTATPTGFTAIANCDVHNIFDKTICTRCMKNFYLNGDYQCEDVSTKSSFQVANSVYISDFSSSDRFNLSSTDSGKCRDQIFDKKSNAAKCVSCVDGFVPVISSKEYATNGRDNGFFADYGKVTCHDPSTFVKKKVGEAYELYVPAAECAEAHFSQSHYSCIKCKNGLNGRYAKAGYSNDGKTDISALNIPTLVSCTDAGSEIILSTSYKGIGYRSVSILANFGDYLENFLYDSCPTAADNLVAILPTTFSANTRFTAPGDGVTAEARYFCKNVSGAGSVANCHMYATDLNSTSGTDYTVATLKCVACKPGFSPTNETTSNGRFVTACTSITNCKVDVPAENTWLNACETCDTGKVHPYETVATASDSLVNYSMCITRTIDNCLIESSANKCYHCALGFTVATNKLACDAVSLTANCETSGFNSGSVQITYGTSPNVYKNNIYQHIEMKYRSIALKGECSVCSADNILMSRPINSGEFNCAPLSEFTGLDVNCKMYFGNESKRCSMCNEGFLISNTFTCVANPNNSFPNCASIKEVNSVNVCDDCAPGYKKDTFQNVCFKFDGCDSYISDAEAGTNQYRCNGCMEGLMVDPRDNKKCIPNIIKNCLIFNEGSKICQTCKPGFIGFTFVTQSTSSLFSYCAEYPYSDEIFKDLAISITRSNTTSNYAYSGHAIHTDLKYDTNKSGKTGFTNQLCIKPGMANCKEYDSYGGACTKCDTGYFVEPTTSNCTINTMASCELQKNLYECDKCKSTHYITPLKQCEPYSVLNCEKYLVSSDGCDDCKATYYNENAQCYKYSGIDNCSEFSPNSNACTKCNTDFYVQNGKCQTFTIVGCKTFDSDKDECKTCFEKHYYSEGKCLRHTAEYCQEYENDENSCDSCIISTNNQTHKGNYKSKDSKCTEFEEIDNCAEYKLSGSGIGECAKCKDNFLNTSDECKPYPTGVRYCDTFVSPTQCSKCIYEYYIDTVDNLCKPVYNPIKNCMEYETATKCSLCVKGFLVNAAGTSCMEKLEESCLTWSTYDSCATCKPYLALVESEQMSSDGVNKIKSCKTKISNCVTLKTEDKVTQVTDLLGVTTSVTTKMYTCDRCSPAYIPSTDKSTCELAGYIAYCYDYESNAICNECKPNFVLSEDKKICNSDIQLVGSNCMNAVVNSTLKCNQCKSGYMIGAENKCVQCGGDGCLTCDPMNTTLCKFCSPGFFMTSAYACTSNPNFPFTLTKEKIQGGDPVNSGASSGFENNHMENTDTDMDKDDSFLKISALILGVIGMLFMIV